MHEAYVTLAVYYTLTLTSWSRIRHCRNDKETGSSYFSQRRLGVLQGKVKKLANS